MGDKPILFSGPMVRALLNGSKTQTRRMLNPQPPKGADLVGLYAPGLTAVFEVLTQRSPDFSVRLRHTPKDRLYVREHWRTTMAFEDLSPAEMKPSVRIRYEADGEIDQRGQSFEHFHQGRFRQGMHMPRWASRLTLAVADVRVERLQDCSAADAIAEGIECVGHSGMDAMWKHYPDGSEVGGYLLPNESYRTLWNSINGPGAWEANPWVAAYTFTVQRGNIDQIGKTD